MVYLLIKLIKLKPEFHRAELRIYTPLLVVLLTLGLLSSVITVNCDDIDVQALSSIYDAAGFYNRDIDTGGSAAIICIIIVVNGYVIIECHAIE